MHFQHAPYAQLLVYNSANMVFGFIRGTFQWMDAGYILGTVDAVVGDWVVGDWVVGGAWVMGGYILGTVDAVVSRCCWCARGLACMVVVSHALSHKC